MLLLGQSWLGGRYLRKYLGLALPKAAQGHVNDKEMPRIRVPQVISVHEVLTWNIPSVVRFFLHRGPDFFDCVP